MAKVPPLTISNRKGEAKASPLNNRKKKRKRICVSGENRLHYYMKENNQLQKLKDELKKLDTYIGYMEDCQGFCERKYKEQFWNLKKKIEETIGK
jgi:hypothetical protein